MYICTHILRMISGIHYEVDLNCTLLGYYAMSCVIAQKKIQTNK